MLSLAYRYELDILVSELSYKFWMGGEVAEARSGIRDYPLREALSQAKALQGLDHSRGLGV